MLEYSLMLHISYYAQNYAGISRQGLPQRLLANQLLLYPKASVT